MDSLEAEKRRMQTRLDELEATSNNTTTTTTTNTSAAASADATTSSNENPVEKAN